jgi:hypothetical protein
VEVLETRLATEWLKHRHRHWQDNSLETESTSDKLVKLKKLLDEGIISKEVFDEKSKKYIEEL